MKPASTNALRTLAVANAVVLSALAVILATWMERPAGLVAGGGCAVSAAILAGLARRLDPYRNDPGWGE